MTKEYIALFEYEDGKEGFGVVFPDLPGCFSGGKDYEDAVRMAHEAVAGYIEATVEYGGTVRKPRTLEQIKAEWDDWKEWEDNYKFMIVPIAYVPAVKKPDRINITLDVSLIARIDRITNNRSAFLANAAEYMLAGKHGHFRRAEA